MVDFHKLAGTFFNSFSYPKKYNYTNKTSTKDFLRLTKNIPPRQPCDENKQKIEILHKEAYDANENLMCAKEKALRILEHITDEKRKLFLKEELLRDMIIKFNKLVVQSRQKRERAKYLMKREKETKKTKQEDIDELFERIISMRQYCKMFRVQVEKYSLYQNFLQSTIYDSNENQTILDIINRFVNLDSKKQYIVVKNDSVNDEFKNLQYRMLYLLDYFHSTLLDLRKTSTCHMVSFEETKKKRNDMEKLILDVWNNCDVELRNLAIALQSIKSLSDTMLCRQTNYEILNDLRRSLKKTTTTSQGIILKQIIHIRKTMGVINKITYKVQRKLKLITRMWENKKLFSNMPIL